MERLFSPCTRLYDLVESQGGLEALNGQRRELRQELNLDVPTEELLSAERAFTYTDLYAIFGSETTVLWLTPYAAVVRDDERVDSWVHQLDGSYRFCFSADDNDIFVLARSHEHLVEICDFILRLLAASIAQSVTIYNWRHLDGIFINAPSLAYLMEQCQSLKFLSLNYREMDEDQIRELGDYSRPDLGIILSRCKFTSTGTSVLAEVLQHNQGPTKLLCCEIDNFVLVDGLRGNSRLKLLKFRISSSFEVGNREIFAIAGVLRENKGLVELKLLHHTGMSDGTWGAICTSLETHPTLEVLDLGVTFPTHTTAPAVITSRVEVLLDMLKVNTLIQAIRLHSRYREHVIFRESVIPRLETNRFRPRLLAIQKTHPIPYNAKVLGRALLSVRNKPNLFWMLLSGNAEIALFPSTTPAGSLPTSTANIAGVAAISPTTCSTGAASTISVSAVDVIAAPM